MTIGSTAFGVMFLVAAVSMLRTGFPVAHSALDRLSLVCCALACSTFGVYVLAGGVATAAPILYWFGIAFMFTGIGLSIISVARAVLTRLVAKRR